MSSAAPAAGRVDRADDDDVEVVARHGAGMERLQVVGGDRGDALQRAFRRPAIGMVAEQRLRPEPAGDLVRIGFRLPQARQHLAADALHRLGVEARLVDREAEELEGLVRVLR